jgi:hypothetical protein
LWPYVQAFIVPVHAAEGDGSALSPDTIVTEDNIDEVIKYLGLDPNDFIKTNTSSDNENSPAITVGEL